MSLARVLMTADAVGGVWDYALQLASLLAGRGVTVVLATMGPPPSQEQRAAAARVAGLDLEVSTFAVEWMNEPWADLQRAGSWLLELERRVRPDVVHLNGYALAALPWQSPVLVVAHSCVVSWWHAVHGSDPPAEWDHYRRAVVAGLSAADAIAAPTRAMRQGLLKHYGVGREAVVIHNCRSPQRWAPGGKEPFVLCAGRAWDNAKNVAALDAAAAHLQWPVRVAGDLEGPGSGRFTPQHLQPLGRQDADAFSRLLGRAAIYALPARYEPFGLSVLEAALCECALVLGDIDSLRENWTGAARFVAPDDVEAFTSTIQELIDDQAQREELGRLARRRAELFSPEQHRDAYYALYESMLRVGRRSVVA